MNSNRNICLQLATYPWFLAYTYAHPYTSQDVPADNVSRIQLGSSCDRLLADRHACDRCQCKSPFSLQEFGNLYGSNTD
jgi:hypothetical protein